MSKKVRLETDRTWTIEDLKRSNVKALFKWPEFKTISETYAEMKIKEKTGDES